MFYHFDSSDPTIARDPSLDVICDRTHASAVPCSEQALPVSSPQDVANPGSISVEPQANCGSSPACLTNNKRELLRNIWGSRCATFRVGKQCF